MFCNKIYVTMNISVGLCKKIKIICEINFVPDITK